MRLEAEEGRVVRHGELELELACTVDDGAEAGPVHREIRKGQGEVGRLLHADGQFISKR